MNDPDVDVQLNALAFEFDVERGDLPVVPHVGSRVFVNVAQNHLED
jgi:hypothetical protein